MARIISHPNVINLQYFFYSNGEAVHLLPRLSFVTPADPSYFRLDAQKKKGEVYLNLVLEFLPETLYRSFRRYADLKQIMPIFSIKVSVESSRREQGRPKAEQDTRGASQLYMYQLLRSLAYIHSLGICRTAPSLDPITGVRPAEYDLWQTATSSRRTSSSIPPPAPSSSSTSAAPNVWSRASPMSRTSARGTTEHQSSSSARPSESRFSPASSLWRAMLTD